MFLNRLEEIDEQFPVHVLITQYLSSSITGLTDSVKKMVDETGNVYYNNALEYSMRQHETRL